MTWVSWSVSSSDTGVMLWNQFAEGGFAEKTYPVLKKGGLYLFYQVVRGVQVSGQITHFIQFKLSGCNPFYVIQIKVDHQMEFCCLTIFLCRH